ncbi:hypothetical protein N9L48_06420 [Psychrosphaera sp.]|nr:hypothetical protein [Psychrosphaera sp.]
MNKSLTTILKVSLSAGVAILSIGCSNMQASYDSETRVIEEKELKKKRTDSCQNAQIDVSEAKATNDKAAIDRAQRMMEKACAESIKNAKSKQ